MASSNVLSIVFFYIDKPNLPILNEDSLSTKTKTFFLPLSSPIRVGLLIVFFEVF